MTTCPLTLARSASEGRTLTNQHSASTCRPSPLPLFPPVQFLLLILFTALLIAFPAKSFAAKPAPPPPLPPVRYHIQYWALPTPIPTKNFAMNTMNNLGQVAGWYVNAAGDQRAYLYDPEINPTAAVDVETEFAPAGIPAGWKIAGTIGINNHGLIVGYLSPVGTGYGAIRQLVSWIWPQRCLRL